MKRFDPPLRIVTYNVHKCRGLDQRVRPARIVEVLQDIDPDIVALQEVLSIEGREREADQARYIAEALGFHFAFGENRRHQGGRYGNVVMSRYPIEVHRNYDITSKGCEPRGCLRTDIQIGSAKLHVFNVHFGTAFMEHRAQARRLFEERIVSHHELTGPRVVLGDFNEWLRGAVTRTLRSHLQGPDIRRYLKRRRTYPGVLPLFNLDHIYYDPALELERLQLHQGRKPLVASDHLPLVADFRVDFSAISSN
jgi:endonuclease/exonuclease/phosphatase family metal-dependent hydrolase